MKSLDIVLRLLPATLFMTAGAAERPNVVVLLTDDQGYADISFNPDHPREVATPHMDALAREGVFFSQAYTSGNVCSPTRAGLMLGRYQQRVGVYTAGEGGSGFDPRLPIFPSFLPEEYACAAIGKWHLGLDTDYPELKWHPLNRGFDACYIFMGRGAHDYFKLRGASGADDTGPLYRGKKRIDDTGYLTSRLTEEACAFIERNKERPFFLYLAYNAVHAPKQAPPESIARVKAKFPDLSEDRAILMGMLYHLDLGVGAVVKTLKKARVWENTLFFFLTDNGGAKAMRANNGRLRGFKGSNWEGGIRTPFVVSWPKRITGGRTLDTPVISLDILPTVVDALDETVPAGISFDGASLLPLLTGKVKTLSRQLFFSGGGATGRWAVRSGRWKLVTEKNRTVLFDLNADPSEASDLAAKHPVTVKALTASYYDWLKNMAPPLSGTPKRWSPDIPSKQERREANHRKRRTK